MKNRFFKKIVITIPTVFIVMHLLKKAMFFFLDNAKLQDNIFLFKSIHETIGIFILLFLIQQEKFLNWSSVFRNNILCIVIASVIIYFSLSHTFQIIQESKSVVSSFNHITYLLLCISVGFLEEFFFRILIFGYVCYSFNNYSSNLKKNYYKEIIITSLLFALAHLTNIFNSDYDYVSVINQIMIAFLLGIVLQSIFIRFNNIWFNAILHGMINYNGEVSNELIKIKDTVSDTDNSTNIFQTLITVLIFSAILFPICYLLIKKKKNMIMETVDNKNFIFKHINEL